jgi:hypothetical protein
MAAPLWKEAPVPVTEAAVPLRKEAAAMTDVSLTPEDDAAMEVTKGDNDDAKMDVSMTPEDDDAMEVTMDDDEDDNEGKHAVPARTVLSPSRSLQLSPQKRRRKKTKHYTPDEAARGARRQQQAPQPSEDDAADDTDDDEVVVGRRTTPVGPQHQVDRLPLVGEAADHTHREDELLWDPVKGDTPAIWEWLALQADPSLDGQERTLRALAQADYDIDLAEYTLACFQSTTQPPLDVDALYRAFETSPSCALEQWTEVARRFETTVSVIQQHFLCWQGLNPPLYQKIQYPHDWWHHEELPRCAVCRHSDHLLACTRCSRGFHLDCAKLTTAPPTQDDWLCGRCVTQLAPRKRPPPTVRHVLPHPPFVPRAPPPAASYSRQRLVRLPNPTFEPMGMPNPTFEPMAPPPFWSGIDPVTIVYVSPMEYDLTLPVTPSGMGMILQGIGGKTKLKGFSRVNVPRHWEEDDIVVAIDHKRVGELSYPDVVALLQKHHGRTKRVLRMRRSTPLPGMPQRSRVPENGKMLGGEVITILDSSEEEDTVPAPRNAHASASPVKPLVAHEILPSIKPLPGNEYELSLPVTSQGIGLRVRKINELPCFSNLLRPLNLAGHQEPVRGDQIIAIDSLSIQEWEYPLVMKCLQNHGGRLMRVLRLKRNPPKAPEDSPERDSESSGTTPVLSPDGKESPKEREQVDAPAPALSVENLCNASTDVYIGAEYDFRVQVVADKLGIAIRERGTAGRGAIFESFDTDRPVDPLNTVQPGSRDLLVAVDKKRVEQMAYSAIVSLLCAHDGRTHRVLRLRRCAK